MKKITAEKIIHHHQLIPGKISRNILKLIINDEQISASMLPVGVTLTQIDEIRQLYKNEINNISDLKTIYPKYLPFYLILKNSLPSFSWNIDDNTIKPKINITAPRVNQLRVSLLSLLLGKTAGANKYSLNIRYSCFDEMPHSVINALGYFLEEVDAIYPPDLEMQEIVNWIARGLKGETLHIFLPVCPDYSAVPTGNPECPMRHTFDSLGFSNGQIAQRLLKALPYLVKMLNALNLKYKIIAGAGDFEAFSKCNLTRLNLTEDEFLQRVDSSRIAFQNAATVNLAVSMITDLCGGKEKWLHYVEKVKQQFSAGNTGLTRITDKILLDIAEKRRLLYSRWYGDKQNLNDYIPIVLAQGMEYSAMGLMISDLYPNCLVFGGDNDCMRYFYCIKERIPTMYLNRYYC